ncbi:hypothetical protein [Emcibacter nanhaiensis]|uniref:Uncharacterized protein n=1 Tax=Emcibacter nanhaiensis TaxID=1505037 RepID=A0A501PQD4_9PROT|nr:hypothetical protein [Emcibacter nanhaiensis]TPD61901.1 hypothetical protein FIV46_06755 [Emcibacter nanhaiensis]
MSEGEFDLQEYLAMVRRDRADTLDCLRFLLEEAQKGGLTSVVELLEQAIPEIEAAFREDG